MKSLQMAFVYLVTVGISKVLVPLKVVKRVLLAHSMDYLVVVYVTCVLLAHFQQHKDCHPM
jgi:hypothetical protein